MKILKNLSIITGMFALIVGVNSCKKEDTNECCTFSYTYDDITLSVTACEDGNMTVSYGDETYTESWKDDYGSWSEMRSEMVDYGATCSK